MFTWLLKLLAGSCRHRHYTFPITIRTLQRGSNLHFPSDIQVPADTYVVCLDCARKFPYDWEQMRVIWEPLNAEVELQKCPEGLPSRAAIPGVLFRFWDLFRKAKPDTA